MGSLVAGVWCPTPWGEGLGSLKGFALGRGGTLSFLPSPWHAPYCLSKFPEEEAPAVSHPTLCSQKQRGQEASLSVLFYG